MRVASLALPACAQDYGLVILNGRVIDPETMYDDIANVGIKDGRSATLTKHTLTGKAPLAAKGLVVAPSCIDTPCHAVDVFATKMALRDGVPPGENAACIAYTLGAWLHMTSPTVC